MKKKIEGEGTGEGGEDENSQMSDMPITVMETATG